MIGEIRGNVVDMDTSHIVVDVSGIGYIVFMPLSDISTVCNGDHIHLYTILIKSESGDSLLGFINKNDRRIAAQLLRVQGVGVKAALSCMAKIPYDAWSDILDSGNVARLKSVPGIGEKTAQKIILELKGKITLGASAPVHEDAKAALMSLGFSSTSINKVLAGMSSMESTQEVIKKALNLLTRAT